MSCHAVDTDQSDFEQAAHDVPVDKCKGGALWVFAI
jgi:hypothetical protein